VRGCVSGLNDEGRKERPQRSRPTSEVNVCEQHTKGPNKEASPCHGCECWAPRIRTVSSEELVDRHTEAYDCIVDDGVDTSVHEEMPCIFGRSNVRFT
jgi:hypothetical protein